MNEKGKANVYYEAAKALSEISGRPIADILKEMEKENTAAVTSEGKMKVADYITIDHQIHKAQLHEQENKPKD